ncbi:MULTISPECIES: ABC transporter permease [unclassified Mycolicibacterium]|uniref:ABC transporter permease n=1 Tax=unclassified Mycolicibacterium TaxID=2636767 RepID=UPI0012DCE891|nr:MULTISPECIES: ABC transporter permease [unclassified Mycolicibacterium]MUL80459.1 ABC transporter permease [Mycolicibacterium sp. CBMA 329]MUL86226.1 ABC transporter permease [Mycolicibacterium sp. CBMA 331]MUM01112.1 ABC transporter permease [Mycolicibacterium sp. CBMA 334]MUM25005.1 ABC transporter permease [Mycolicibacterium sp. CBMA 295]MUM36522.1 ABC transporter permease [Mycolicibacterium sp. CBMA 247]
MSAIQLAPRRVRRSGDGAFTWVTWVCVGFLAIVVGMAVAGPWIAPYDALQVDALDIHALPSVNHLLGTDDTGRDIFSRIIVGARPSLVGPALVVLTAALVGTLLAVTAAWRRGWADALISRIFDLLFAFPGLILAIIAVTVFGRGLLSPVLALAVSYVPYIGRVVRVAALRERSQPYVAALQIQGFSPVWICVRHVVPNLLPVVVVQTSLAFGYALLDLAAISYIGLGVQPPDPEWGLMVANGQSSILSGYPQQSIFAGLIIVATVVCVNLVGTRLAARVGGR